MPADSERSLKVGLKLSGSYQICSCSNNKRAFDQHYMSLLNSKDTEYYFYIVSKTFMNNIFIM